MRVAEFTDNYGPGSNGLMVAVQQLEGNLLDAGHEVIVVAPRAKGPNPHHRRPGRTEIRLPSIRVPNMPTRVANGRRFESAVRRLGVLKPDVIHVHGLGPVGGLGIWAAKRLQLPLLLTWHTDFDAYADHYSLITPVLGGVVRALRRIAPSNLVDKEEFKLISSRYEADRGRSTASLLAVAQKMLEMADVVTSPSPKTAARCREMAPTATVLTVPNGVDALPPGPPPVKHGGGPLVLYAGRIAPEKGLPLLIEAFDIVRALRPDAQLMVVGDWERYPRLRRMLAVGRRKGAIILPGEQKRENLGAFYGMADVFAFPSQTDTQALVLHEAALAGLPIVSVDPGLRLVIEPGANGEVTRPTAQSLAAGIVRVLDKLEDPAWKQSASETSRRLASQWSIESQATVMLQIYADLADGVTPQLP